jgi:single-strand DNA-binding protein
MRVLPGFQHRVLEFKIMASRSVNKVILVGNLGRDAETKFTPSGSARTTFSVATNRRIKDQQTGEWKDETDWVNVVLWRAENLANYLTRGKQVYVEGRLHTRNYDDKDGKKVYVTEVVAEDVILLSGGGQQQGPADEESGQMASMPRSAQQSRPRVAQMPSQHEPMDAPGGGVSDDDVPF